MNNIKDILRLKTVHPCGSDFKTNLHSLHSNSTCSREDCALQTVMSVVAMHIATELRAGVGKQDVRTVLGQ